MLYVSTRNTDDTYTAYRALHETYAPDGGFYVPFYLPSFSKDELASFKVCSSADVIAQILNMFFGLHLSSWDVECAIGRMPFKLETMHHKLLLAELWRNPESSFAYLQKSLYRLMTNDESMDKLPTGWSRIGIEVALLFSIHAAMEEELYSFDIAVTTGDYADALSVFCAKAMGLPVDLTVCTSEENSIVWDLLNRGEFSVGCTQTDTATPNYFESFLYMCMGKEAVSRYLDACARKGVFYIDEIQQESLRETLFAAVASKTRADTVITSIFRTNQYQVSPDAALAFGGLQDYRSATGVSRDTLILAKVCPARIKG